MNERTRMFVSVSNLAYHAASQTMRAVLQLNPGEYLESFSLYEVDGAMLTWLADFDTLVSTSGANETWSADFQPSQGVTYRAEAGISMSAYAHADYTHP